MIFKPIPKRLMYQSIEVNDQSQAPFSWKAYHQTVNELLLLNPSINLFSNPSEDKFRQMILGRNQYAKGNFKTFTFFQEARCVGILEVMVKPRMGYLSILPNRTDIELINCITEICRSCEIDTLRITTAQAEVKDMLQKGGQSLLIHDVIQELQKDSMDMEVIDFLTKSGLSYMEEQGFVLKSYTKLEGDILDKYVVFHNEVIRDILVYDMENGVEAVSTSMVKEKSEQMKRMGGGLLYLILFDNTENTIGLTEVWIADLENCDTINCGLTAIKKEYRQQGIAQFLKAKMIQQILRDFEGFCMLETANSVVNIPVLKLNEKFGFQKVSEEFVFAYSH
ncbi:MAG: hypothetical protein ACPGVB_04770 [Chitinophagales bacterium]